MESECYVSLAAPITTATILHDTIEWFQQHAFDSFKMSSFIDTYTYCNKVANKHML